MIEAMNDMGTLGWELKQTYTASNGNSTTFYWVVQGKILDASSPPQEGRNKEEVSNKERLKSFIRLGGAEA